MKFHRALRIASLASLLSVQSFAADDYQPGPDSLPQPGIPKGAMLKDKYLAKEGSVFPGTEREYQIYLPAGLDTSKPAPFMVFQDGVIYQAPVVFDNLIAKKEIPPLIGIFIKPGVVPAANDNALPRFNRSYEYDSVTDSYSRFLIDEFLPAIAAKHKLNLSTDPNARGIAGSSSGGICAFMVAWHRPDSFRRVFTSVGTYVGIHGADQLPVLVRKYEPKPLRVFLQSGENDNNLYCGDWWMANQMMERSLTWNGYDVNHAWGKGGHNQKHATAIFPDVLRWLWKGYPDEPVKANSREDAKWRGGEVIGKGEWSACWERQSEQKSKPIGDAQCLTADKGGRVFASLAPSAPNYEIDSRVRSDEPTHWIQTGVADDCVSPFGGIVEIKPGSHGALILQSGHEEVGFYGLAVSASDSLLCATEREQTLVDLKDAFHSRALSAETLFSRASICLSQGGIVYVTERMFSHIVALRLPDLRAIGDESAGQFISGLTRICLSPDQTILYATSKQSRFVYALKIGDDHLPNDCQSFGHLEETPDGIVDARGLCVDTNGWLYVATSLGVQVLDQAGRVNFIIPTPKQPYDVCFGGKDLSELFIACGDTIYKRQTKARGYISGQMAPIKPPPPKL